jgi:hypothetical protein
MAKGELFFLRCFATYKAAIPTVADLQWRAYSRSYWRRHVERVHHLPYLELFLISVLEPSMGSLLRYRPPLTSSIIITLSLPTSTFHRYQCLSGVLASFIIQRVYAGSISFVVLLEVQNTKDHKEHYSENQMWTTECFDPAAVEAAGVSDLVEEFEEFVTTHRGTIRRVNGGRVYFTVGVQYAYRPPPGVLVDADVDEEDATMCVGYFTDPDWFQGHRLLARPKMTELSTKPW